MNKVAICFMTKDRVELSQQTILPLLGRQDKFDLWWMDGSTTLEGEELPERYATHAVRHNVRGGPDAAVAYAVTTCLDAGYDYIGIVENDVLLGSGWFENTMALFDRAQGDGLRAGAASARCYEDRVLFRREGYNVCHNLGFGMVIWTRKAAGLMLKYMRTSWTLENRRTFMRLANVDIGTYWAFRIGEHWLCADWGVDRVLADHGLCSVALDPSPVEMIGQDPPLDKQGLVLATGRDLGFAHDTPSNFERFVANQGAIGAGNVSATASVPLYQVGVGGFMYFPHHFGEFRDFEMDDNWQLHWLMGFGPFAYRAGPNGATMRMRISGPCQISASGHDKGGTLRIRDLDSGYEVDPMLPAANGQQASIMGVLVPGQVCDRVIELEASPGVLICGITVEQPQATTGFSFNHAALPPVA